MTHDLAPPAGSCWHGGRPMTDLERQHVGEARRRYAVRTKLDERWREVLRTTTSEIGLTLALTADYRAKLCWGPAPGRLP